ncbi:hypothetical protein HZA57_07940 [Candidatus Poribacteria bacterium]|nr:hypothetical protein [Candidatus Poribacteria bacterium]
MEARVFDWEWRLLGVPAEFVQANPLAAHAIRRRVPALPILLAGLLTGLWAGGRVAGGGPGALVWRIVAGDLLAAAGAILMLSWSHGWWLRSDHVDDLDLTALSDGELSHGLWAPGLVPLVRFLVAECAGETLTMLWTSALEVDSRSGKPLPLLAIVNWGVLPAALMLFHAGTLAMLGPRVSFICAQSATAHGFWLRCARTLAECYTIVLMVLVFACLTSILFAIALAPLGGHVPLVVLTVMVLLTSHVKRSVSDSYALALRSSWRAWICERREALANPRDSH